MGSRQSPQGPSMETKQIWVNYTAHGIYRWAALPFVQADRLPAPTDSEEIRGQPLVGHLGMEKRAMTGECGSKVLYVVV